LGRGLAAFYRQVSFGHIEAGLRTDTVDNPFPEEFNRRTLGLFAAQHYAPTSWSADDLRREGEPNDRIIVTGNTGIDVVMHIAEQPGEVPENGRIILMTTHRRENWREPQANIARAAWRWAWWCWAWHSRAGWEACEHGVLAARRHGSGDEPLLWVGLVSGFGGGPGLGVAHAEASVWMVFPFFVSAEVQQ
jgi:hypothetical protein